MVWCIVYGCAYTTGLGLWYGELCMVVHIRQCLGFSMKVDYQLGGTPRETIDRCQCCTKVAMNLFKYICFSLFHGVCVCVCMFVCWYGSSRLTQPPTSYLFSWGNRDLEDELMDGRG